MRYRMRLCSETLTESFNIVSWLYGREVRLRISTAVAALLTDPSSGLDLKRRRVHHSSAKWHSLASQVYEDAQGDNRYHVPLLHGLAY